MSNPQPSAAPSRAGVALAALREHRDHPVTALTSLAEPGMDAAVTALVTDRLARMEESAQGVYALIPFAGIRAASDALNAYFDGHPDAARMLARALGDLLDGAP